MTGQVKLGFRWVSSVIIFNLLLVPPRIPRSICNECSLFHRRFAITYCTVPMQLHLFVIIRVVFRTYINVFTGAFIRGKIFNPRMLLTLSDIVIVAILIGKFYMLGK